MTSRELIAAFETIAEAPDGAARLRELILELAVRGTLVAQHPKDTPADVPASTVYGQGRTARKPRDGRPDLPMKDAGTPWELPKGWIWTCTAALGVLSPRYSAADDELVAFCPMPAIPTDFRDPIRPEQRRWGDIKRAYTHFADGDVVVAKITPCFQNGKSCVIEGLNGIGAGTTELHVISPVAESVDPKYLLLFYKSRGFIDGGVARMTGTAGQQRVPSDYFAFRPVPLPPLAEQHRIVARVDELMGLLDCLEAARTSRNRTRAAARDSALEMLREASTTDDLEAAWTRYSGRLEDLLCEPEDIGPLRQAILAFAMRGRLVPQDSAELPANAKAGTGTAGARGKAPGSPHSESLQPSAISNVPFPVPTSWAWMRLAEVCRIFSDCLHKTPEYISTGSFLAVRPRDVTGGVLRLAGARRVSKQTFLDQSRKHRLVPGDVVYSRELSLGWGVVVPEGVDLCMSQGMMVMRPASWVDLGFFMYLINGPVGRSQAVRDAVGAAHLHLNLRDIGNFAVPIPPHAEQRRIVARVDELMRLLDQLEDRLTRARAAQVALAAAAVHHLVGYGPSVAGSKASLEVRA